MRRWLMVAVVAALTTSGCSRAPQLQDVGLPGSRVQDGYEISAVFDDVLDLVPLATVKLDGVKVGVVSSVELADDYAARAVLTIEPDAEIPRQATASIEQTSLLGEKYIELESPGDGPPDAMREGEVIPLSRTGAGVEVETLLSGASALLNGGGIGQLEVVTRELNLALQGREKTVRTGLRDLDAVVATLNRRRGDIVRAIDGLDQISRTVAADRVVVESALDELPSGIEALAGQRRALTQALAELDGLGQVAGAADVHGLGEPGVVVAGGRDHGRQVHHRAGGAGLDQPAGLLGGGEVGPAPGQVAVGRERRGVLTVGPAPEVGGHDGEPAGA